MYGGSGNDKLFGGSGNDLLNGGDGKDLLDGGTGNDSLIGGKGIDTAVFSYRSNTIKLTTTRRQNTGDGRDVLTGIENVNGGGGNDMIYGNKGANTLKGDSGKDKLYGGSGNDKLFGGSGSDTLDGGIGNDIIYGGTGNDTFKIRTATGRDVIKDFTDGKDRIHLLTGSRTVSLSQLGDNVNVHHEGDLMAIIENITTSELNQNGQYLI